MGLYWQLQFVWNGNNYYKHENNKSVVIPVLRFHGYYIFCTVHQFRWHFVSDCFPFTLQVGHGVLHSQIYLDLQRLDHWLVAESRHNRLLCTFFAVLSPSSLPACFVEANASRGRGNGASKRDVLQKLDVSSQASICC